MDPNALQPLQQIGQQGPMTLATIISAVAIGLGLAVKWWVDRTKRDSADGVTRANDSAAKAAAVTTDSAIHTLWAMVTDLRAQQQDLSATVQKASSQRNEAAARVAYLERAVANLQHQLAAANSNNSRLLARVLHLENQMHAAGLPIPPDQYHVQN